MPRVSPEQPLLFEFPASNVNPEAGIDNMHKKMRSRYTVGKFLAEEDSYERSQKRKNLGLTQKRKTRELEESSKEAVQKLEELGWLEMIVLRDATFEEREFFRTTMAKYRPPSRDLDSSVGITIYPDQLSWLLDVYGGEHLYRKFRERKSRG